MADVTELIKAIATFEFGNQPSSENIQEPLTVADIRKIINETTETMHAFLEELDKHK